MHDYAVCVFYIDLCMSDLVFISFSLPTVPLLQFVTLPAQQRKVFLYPEGVWPQQEALPFDHLLKTPPLLVNQGKSLMVSSHCAVPAEILVHLNTTPISRSLHPRPINPSPPVLLCIPLVAPTQGLLGSNFHSRGRQNLRSPSTFR